jgi:phosphotransferase system  glucose/maltose/N-acetylglucosamine-specific IIC component
MDDLRRKLKAMTLEEVISLTTILMASMLGTMGSGAFLKWALAQNIGTTGERLALSLVATMVYAVIIFITFYLLMPKSRLAFRKIWLRRK